MYEIGINILYMCYYLVINYRDNKLEETFIHIISTVIFHETGFDMLFWILMSKQV